MNRIYALFLGVILGVTSVSLQAQSVANYAFAQSSGTFTPITGGTVLGTATFDDNNYNANPIGFNFWYNGQQYSTFSVNANGFIALGNTVSSSYTSISTGSSNQVIAAFNFDLQANVANPPVSNGGEIRYETTGVAPNRTLVIQYLDLRPYLASGISYNFQIRLKEADNSIDVVYGSFTETATTRNAQVGLRGTSNAQYNNRLVVSGTNTWDLSLPGVANSSTCQSNSTTFPATGQKYQWTPTPPAAPTTLTFSTIGATGMTLNWLDNSTNEGSFQVFVSTDNITYSQVGSVTSTSTATTGSPYNYIATGLNPSTLYYWQVYAVSEVPSLPVSGSQATNAPLLCGTYTVGPTGAYTSLTAALNDLVFNSLTCPVIFELQAAYNSSVETFPLNLGFFGGSAVKTLTVRPEIGATGLSITSADLLATLRLNKATYATFDGRPGGIGTSRELTISNSDALSASAILFENNTQNCVLTYLNLRGAETSTTSGVVRFGNALATGGGNSNNNINNCDIYDGATTPTNIIYSFNATASTFNENNTIQNNLIRNFFSATSGTVGIGLAGGNNAWNITDNSIYQTSTRTYTTGNTHVALAINNTGSGYTIANNFIGGTAPNCGGTAYTMAGTTTTRFIGIGCTATGANVNTITNNTIRNFVLNSSSGAATLNGIWCGINVTGTASSANVNNNIIGNNTTSGNILATSTTGGGMVVGINIQATGVVNVNNNSIGSLTSIGSTNTQGGAVTGINFSSSTGVGLRTASGNTIGSALIPNSLTNNPATSGSVGSIVGINVLINGIYSITNNTISGIANLFAGTGTTSITRGINVTSGVATITGNQIAGVTTNASHTSTGSSAGLIGINFSATTIGTPNLIQGNTIGGLFNLNTGTVGVHVYGINYGSSNAGTIQKNNIGYLGSNSTGTTALTTPTIIGISSIGSGAANFFNNFVNLGLNPDGASRTASHIYEGFRKATFTNNKIAFNTIAIQGTGVTGTFAAPTYAFNRTSTGVDSVYNNVLVNTRSNATTGGKHYSISLNNTTTFVSRNNDLFGNGTGYVLGVAAAVDYANLAAWQAIAAGWEGLSISADPNFVSSTDLHINIASPSQLESTGQLFGNVSDDVDNQLRPGPVPSVNGGAINPDMGADEHDGIPVPNSNIDLSVLSVVNPSNTDCFTNNQLVTVRVKNNGLGTHNFVTDSATITVTVTGPNPATLPAVVVNTGTLASGATLDVNLPTPYNMSAFGNYGFTASLVVNNDINTANNSKVKSVTSVGQTTVNAGSDVAICEGLSTNLSAIATPALTNVTNSNNTVTPIPDGNAVGVSSPITIPASFASVLASGLASVNLTITHAWNSDLAITLIAPNNSQITLSNGNGGSGDNYNNVTFTMSAAANITTAPTNTITGSWIPQQSFAGLTGNAAGTWQLKVVDAFTPDAGILQNWSITLPGPQTVTYTWTPSTGLSSTTIANPVANPTTTTNYSVQVTDERGCTASDNVLVTVNTNPVITKTTIVPTCVPGFDGIIDISVAGNPGFNYNWNTTATTQDLTGLSFGTYILTVTDTNSCISTDTTVFQVVGFNVTGNITNVSCFNGNDGAVDITVVGGTLPYSAYAWSNSATTEDINTLVDGSYSVTVTDAVGCTTTNSFTVTEPTALASSFAVTNVDCNSNATGIVDLTPAGGTTPYTYAWSNSATTEDINALVSGSYIVTITDDNNCILIDTAVVTQPNALATTIDTTNVSCFGFDDGEADLTVSGGTTPYSYAWTNSATTQDLINLAPGNYTVIVTDANNCIISDSLLITEPDTLQTTVQSTDVICYGENSGIGIVTPQGGTVPYDYLWSSGATDSLANFVAGNFTVIVTDANGCTSTNSISIDQPLLLTASIIESANVTCNDAADGSATVVAGFGTPTYTYAWSNGNTTPSVSSLDAGTYSVVVTDINGCTAMDEVVITEPTAIDASDIINNEVYGYDGAINITPSGGQLPYNYNWSNGATSQDINGLIAGTYTVTITDGNGCTESFTYTVMSTMNVEGAATEIGNIQFYPNPSDGIFNMNVAGFNGSSMNVEIMDMNGKVVNVSRIENASQNFTQSFDVRTLSEGTYFIRVTSETGSATSRMVIVK